MRQKLTPPFAKLANIPPPAISSPTSEQSIDRLTLRERRIAATERRTAVLEQIAQQKAAARQEKAAKLAAAANDVTPVTLEEKRIAAIERTAREKKPIDPQEAQAKFQIAEQKIAATEHRTAVLERIVEQRAVRAERREKRNGSGQQQIGSNADFAARRAEIDALIRTARAEIMAELIKLADEWTNGATAQDCAAALRKFALTSTLLQ